MSPSPVAPTTGARTAGIWSNGISTAKRLTPAVSAGDRVDGPSAHAASAGTMPPWPAGHTKSRRCTSHGPHQLTTVRGRTPTRRPGAPQVAHLGAERAAVARVAPAVSRARPTGARPAWMAASRAAHDRGPAAPWAARVSTRGGIAASTASCRVFRILSTSSSCAIILSQFLLMGRRGPPF